MVNRRDFVKGAAMATVGALTARGSRAWGLPLNLPLGLQLYSVREMLAKDYGGTLKQIAALGFTTVEAAGFFGHSAAEVKSAMQSAGLRLVSAHSSAGDLQKSFPETLAMAEALGLQYLICSFPAIKDPSRLKNGSFANQVEAFTLEDFRWNAEQFNNWGRQAKAKGIQFGYHNHTMEFAPKEGGVVPFDEMLRLTDPALVTFEMDCGWVKVGGGDPVAYLKKYPQRISMLHIKDFKTGPKPGSITEPPPAAELGRGTVDFPAIYRAARGSAVKYAFVEQEQFDMPPFEALKVDAEYIKHLTV